MVSVHCDHLIDGHCAIASDTLGEPVAVTPEACAACSACPRRPQRLNYVTASLMIAKRPRLATSYQYLFDEQPQGQQTMKWAYAVTTVPERFDDLLPRTLVSLAGAGFNQPHLFVDRAEPDCDWQQFNLSATVRYGGALRTAGNWVCALWELYARFPEYDRYAIFQDDIILYRNLRQYLEQIVLEENTYWNLYTYAQNEKQFDNTFVLSNQLGKGALGLVFDRKGVVDLLSSEHLVKRPQDPRRGHRAIDGGIVDSLKQKGYKELCHMPSLCQHTGLVSSMGNGQQELAPSFRGEDYNALDMLTVKKQHIDTTRIGLVGYNVSSGLGTLNRQLAEHCEIDRWLVKPHGKFTMLPSSEFTDTLVCPQGVKIPQFLTSIDTVLFCETPYYGTLVDTCRRLKKRIVCVPMLEWMPAGAKGWPQKVDLFICPTRQCYNTFSHVVPCVYFPWPVDVPDEWFEQTTCDRFLFVNGRGGYKGRKGSDVIRRLIELWPEIPLTIIDQTKSEWPQGQHIEVRGHQRDEDVYRYGNVLLYPASVDGIGLQPMEAMAHGLPVITTDGEPWNEIPALGRIPSTVTISKIARPVTWYRPDATALMALCKDQLGQLIQEQSQNARKWAANRNWETQGQALTTLIREGCSEKPTSTKPNERAKPTLTRAQRRNAFFFDEAIAKVREFGGSHIVEIGGIRDTSSAGREADGHSTLRWAESSMHVVSIDTDSKVTASSRRLLNGHENVDLITGDGLKFLSEQTEPIDLLYLDGPNPEDGGQTHALECLKAAKLAQRCVVLIDDCDFADGGKGRYAVHYACNNLGFRLVKKNRQALLVRS